MTLAEELHAIRHAAVLGSLAPRRQVAVAGADRATYLQGLLTNDIERLTPGTGCYAAWLTPQGRMLTDLDVLESGELILLDLPAAEADATLQRLDQFIFTEDVQVQPLDGRLTGVWVHGPGAPGVVARALEDVSAADEWPDYTLRRARFHDAHVMAARMDRLRVPGICLYVAPETVPTLLDALSNAGAVSVSAEAIEAARIEAGYPLYGVDMHADTIPLEAGIEVAAISFTKGCYVGQEVIIRVLHRGGGRVAKKLVGLRLEGPPVPAGTPILSSDREIGVVTSAALSPDLGGVALGYVHRDFVEPGTAVRVRSAGGDIAAVVTARPMR